MSAAFCSKVFWPAAFAHFLLMLLLKKTKNKNQTNQKKQQYLVVLVVSGFLREKSMQMKKKISGHAYFHL